jgi:hypothetical protein
MAEKLYTKGQGLDWTITLKTHSVYNLLWLTFQVIKELFMFNSYIWLIRNSIILQIDLTGLKGPENHCLTSLLSSCTGIKSVFLISGRSGPNLFYSCQRLGTHCSQRFRNNSDVLIL